MRTYIQNIIDKYKEKDINFKMRVIKEYIQENILYILYLKGFMSKLIFEGGTALRFLWNLKRFSEYIDFSVDVPLKDISTLGETITKELRDMGYSVESHIKGKRHPEKRLFFKFPEILKDTHLSSQKGQKLSVLVEIDTHPPSGGKTETTILNREYIFIVRHYTLSSLMAKKIHAVLFRKFIKGRDYYDLFWFLSRKVVPDVGLLNRAVQQTNPKFKKFTEKNWRDVLMEALEETNFNKVRDDVLPFLEIPSEADLLTIANFSKILHKNYIK